jgi:hypothetical protein
MHYLNSNKRFPELEIQKLSSPHQLAATSLTSDNLLRVNPHQQRRLARARSSMQSQHIAIVAPLLVGAVAQLFTIAIFLLPVRATINLIRREKNLGHVGRPWMDLGIFARVVFYASVAHMIEIGFWGVLFMLCGEFTDFGTAFYHSAVNYTSLGYGDFLMSPKWRLLGPLETANGTLLFGVTTAMVFAVLLWLIQARFADLRD